MVTPQEAWLALAAGNSRFVTDRQLHPSQDAHRRNETAVGQNPIAAVFGCSDSRVAAEIIFDQGLGDLFVVRTAGHVVDSGVLGSIEYATAALNVPLLLVLGHDSCGAVAATAEAIRTGEVPGGFVRDLVERVIPGLLRAGALGDVAMDSILAYHVKESVQLLKERSQVINSAVSEGRLGIVGGVYQLREGKVRVVHVEGDVDAALTTPEEFNATAPGEASVDAFRATS